MIRFPQPRAHANARRWSTPCDSSQGAGAKTSGAKSSGPKGTGGKKTWSAEAPASSDQAVTSATWSPQATWAPFSSTRVSMGAGSSTDVGGGWPTLTSPIAPPSATSSDVGSAPVVSSSFGGSNASGPSWSPLGTTIFVLPSTAAANATLTAVASSIAAGNATAPTDAGPSTFAASATASASGAGDDGHGGLSGGQIAGASVGSVACAIALAGVVGWWLFGRPPRRPFENN